VTLDRKSLAELAVYNPNEFARLAAMAAAPPA
jgi:ribosomal protein L20